MRTAPCLHDKQLYLLREALYPEALGDSFKSREWELETSTAQTLTENAASTAPPMDIIYSPTYSGIEASKSVELEKELLGSDADCELLQSRYSSKYSKLVWLLNEYYYRSLNEFPYLCWCRQLWPMSSCTEHTLCTSWKLKYLISVRPPFSCVAYLVILCIS